MDKAEQLFTEIFWRTCKRYTDIEVLRYRIKQNLPITQASIEDEARRFAYSLAFDTKYKDIIVDQKTFLKVLGGLTGISKKLITKNLNSYQASIDASSIILAHSALDCAAIDYCRVVKLIAPTDWERFIQNRKTPLSDLKQFIYEEILNEKLEKYLEELDHQSLLKKIDKLFQLCQPNSDFSPIFNYTFDRDKLEKIDEIRNDIVHGKGLLSPLTTCDEDIIYLRDTSIFVMALVNIKYDLKINPAYLKNV